MFSNNKRSIQIDDYIYTITQDKYYEILKLLTELNPSQEGSLKSHNTKVKLKKIKESYDSIKPSVIIDVDLTEF